MTDNLGKTVGMRIRVDPMLRDTFVETCRQEDTPAAQVIRAFMRDFVRKHQASRVTLATTVVGRLTSAKQPLDTTPSRANLKSKTRPINK